MADPLQSKQTTGGDNNALPIKFIILCVFAFIGSVAATIYFCRSMSGEMGMPGGWSMSMIWMRMQGQTWLASAANFLLMWLAMMMTMMLPSALPTFLSTKRSSAALVIVAAGYFAVWLTIGVKIYVLGVVFAMAAMRWESFSHIVPILAAVTLIIAGGIQFTHWKMTTLRRCRSPFGCVTSCPEDVSHFRLGCKQGIACCLCCIAPMMTLIVLGMMNPFVILGIALVITMEKLLPRPIGLAWLYAAM